MVINASKIAKGIFFLTIVFVFRKAITFVYFTFIARSTNIETTGHYYLFMTLVSLGVLISDLGLTPMMVAYSGKNQESFNSNFNTVIFLKTAINLILLPLIFLYWLWLKPTTFHFGILLLFLGMMIFHSYSYTFYSAIRFKKNMVAETRGITWGHLLMIILGMFFLKKMGTLFFILLATFSDKLFNLIYSSYYLMRENIVLRMKVRGIFWRGILIRSFPYFISTNMNRFFFWDSLVLSYFGNTLILGLYSVPSAIIKSCEFIPLAVSTVLFPIYSNYLQSPDKIEIIFEKSVESLLLICLPLIVGINVLAHNFIPVIFGSRFLVSVSLLQIMSFSLLPFFLNATVGSLLTASIYNKAYTILTIIAAFLHIVLGYLLVSFYGGKGMAWTGVISQTFLYIGGIYLVSKVVGVKNTMISIKKGGRIFFASIIMGTILFFLKDRFYFLPNIIVGIGIYVFLIFILYGLTRNGFDKNRAQTVWVGLVKYLFVK